MTTNHESGVILMVAGVPVGGSYIGGIGVSTRRLLEYWSLPIRVVHLNTELRARSYGSTGRLRLCNVLTSLVNFVRLNRSVAKVHPTLVHWHTSRGLALLKDMMFAGWLRYVLRVRTVLHIRSSDPATILLSNVPRWQRLQLRLLQRCCHRLVFLSENVVSAFAAVLGGDHAREFQAHCTVLPNFTLLQKSYRRHEEPPEGVRLFYIGNLGREKGMHDLMKATRQLKGRAGRVFSVVLAGPFDSEEEGLRIRQLVTDYGLEDTVIFLGPVSGIKKEQAFLHADVFVLPSYSEGIPQSMLEAMAYGLPVVVSGVGGIPEVVREGVEGIIVKPGDIEGLCQALRQVMESVECRARMGNAGRRRVAEQYTVSTYMERLHTLYRSVLPPGAMSCSP